MKLVCLDGYALNPGDLSWEAFENLMETKIYDRTSENQIIDRIGSAECILTNKTPLGKKEFDACPNLKYIGVLATGYNIVDIEEAKKRGITITNIPSYSTDAVAQFTFALLLEIAKHVGHHSKRVAEGAWTNSIDFTFWDYPMFELNGKTLGIIGMGRIGQAVAKIAQAFNMEVLAYSPRNKKGKYNYKTIDEIYEQSDIISLHCPLKEENYHMINTETINKMKKGVIIINTARGALIDEDAAVEGLNSGKIANLAMDVLTEEPPKTQSPLLNHPNCIITPHIAWAPKETRIRLMETAAANLKAFINKKPINTI